MERSSIVCLLLLGLVSQSLVTTSTAARSLEGSIPKDSRLNPDCNCMPDPSHGTPIPTPTPSHGTPTPSSHHGTPSTPSHHGTPSTPSHHGTPSTPSHGTPSHGSYSSPPAVVTPPSTHVPTPTTPVISHPPSPAGPHVPPYFPGNCTYWSSHPDAIWAIFGYWGTMGQSFGGGCILAYGKDLSLPDALKNPRTDGIGALYREGTAALLNSLACRSFPFATQEVKDLFGASTGSDEAAAAQAEVFKQANEGRFHFH